MFAEKRASRRSTAWQPNLSPGTATGRWAFTSGWSAAGGRCSAPAAWELLEGIDRWRSISGAARAMRMSYRRAWLLVQGMNEAAGEALVEAATRGREGGGAWLTPHGREAVLAVRDQQHPKREHSGALLRPAAREGHVVHVAAASSLEEVLGRLQADYAFHEPAVRVRAVFGASDELAELVLAGAPADLFLSADGRTLDRLEAARLVPPETRVPFAANTLAAVGSADRSQVVRRPADLARPWAGRVVLAHGSSPLGGYTRAYLESLGLYEALRPRAVFADSAAAVTAAVRAGQAEVGIVYGSEAARAADCRVLFRARGLPVPFRYMAALVGRGPGAARARSLLDFFTSGEAQRRFRSCGFLTARPPTDD